MKLLILTSEEVIRTKSQFIRLQQSNTRVTIILTSSYWPTLLLWWDYSEIITGHNFPHQTKHITNITNIIINIITMLYLRMLFSYLTPQSVSKNVWWISIFINTLWRCELWYFSVDQWCETWKPHLKTINQIVTEHVTVLPALHHVMLSWENC